MSNKKRLRSKHLQPVCLALSLLLTSQASLPENLFDADRYRAITADKKASRVGDTVTLVIVEKAQAESRAGTDGDKNFDVAARGVDTTSDIAVSAGVGAASGSDASTSRQGFVSAQLALTVKGINPYGNLIVDGEQKIVINGETQQILVSGVLRPEDIDRQNRALSSSLTDANIQFLGEGTVGDQQDHNVFYKILNWLGLL
ncbi:MAG: flagellar basal body L-ring protein FlgH [Pseudomonadota bacterium]